MRLFWIRVARIVPVLCIALVLQFMSLQASAQTFFGSLLGTVTDATGSVVPGATVKLTNTGTAESRSATTDSTGGYRFVSLVPGSYRLNVEMNGFKSLSRDKITINVDAAVRADVTLEIGNVTDTVEVESTAPLLQTESTSVSQVVEGRNVTEMPLNGRDPLSLIALVPGVIPGNGAMASAAVGNIQNATAGAHTAATSWGNFSIGGGLGGFNAIFLDGSPLNLSASNAPGLMFSQDAVQEFRVESNNVSPEFGRFGGGVVNMTTKSGSNQFHGSAYEYARNTVMNANNWFNKRAGKVRPPFHQNQFGATVSGPAWKNKTFFFASWEEFIKRYGIPYLNFVPTTAQLSGDFSASLGASTGVINPCTGNPILQGQIFDPTTTTTVGGVTCRLPFAGNIIPANRMDQAANVAMNVIKYFPAPNTNQAGGNFQSTPNSGGDQKLYTFRIDHNLSDRQRLFGRFSYADMTDLSFNPTLNKNGNPNSDNIEKNIVVGDTLTLNATTVLDLRLSYLRAFNNDNPPSLGTDLSQFGPAWSNLNGQIKFKMLPQIQVAGMIQFRPQTVFSLHYNNNYVGSIGLTKILNRHTLKFGVEARMLDSNAVGTTMSSGSFQFNAAFTSADGTTSSATGGKTGAATASLMLGNPATGSIQGGAWIGQYGWYQGLYANDTFQVGKRLTVNYGIRWELPGSLAERHNLATVFLPNMADAYLASTSVKPNGTLAMVASDQWGARTMMETKHNLFAPRVGMVYRVTDNLVVRGGYGISYLPAALNTDTPSNSALVSATTSMVTSVNNAGLIPYNTLSNPFPATGGGATASTQQAYAQAAGRSQSFLNSLHGGSISSVIPQQAYPYVQQWNVNVGRQFKGNLLAEIGYVGSHGTHLPMAFYTGSYSINQIPNSALSQGAALTASTANPFFGLNNAANAVGKANTTVGQLLRPFPQYSQVSSNGLAVGSNVFNSMQAKIEKRFGASGIVMLNYTWAKMMGNSDSPYESSNGVVQDFNNLSNERALLSTDTRHRVVASYIYDLPFGKGQKYLHSLPVVLDKLIAGWSLNGTTTLQDGFPLYLTAQATAVSTSFGGGTPRPNVAAGCSTGVSGSAQSRIGKWFNTACFSAPSNFGFGNERRSDDRLKGAGVANWDMSFVKAITLHDHVNFQFRAEFFNLFNRTQFAFPAMSYGVSSFGTVSAQLNNPRLVQFAGKINF